MLLKNAGFKTKKRNSYWKPHAGVCMDAQATASALRAELESAKEELSTLTESLVLLQRQKAEAELGRYVCHIYGEGEQQYKWKGREN